MAIAEQALEVLRAAEEKLRALLSQAAKSGDYSSVVRVAAWAQTVSGLANSKVVELPPSEATRKTTSTPPISSTRLRGRASNPVQNGYPRFFRQGDELIRIAWSKKEKKEYRHKTPYAALKALADTIAIKGVDGRVFATDEFLPIRLSDGVEVPNYQAYVGISFLKQTGLIDQHGRQGYSIPRAGEVRDAVEAFWRKLPDR